MGESITYSECIVHLERLEKDRALALSDAVDNACGVAGIDVKAAAGSFRPSLIDFVKSPAFCRLQLSQRQK